VHSLVLVIVIVIEVVPFKTVDHEQEHDYDGAEETLCAFSPTL